MLTPIQVEYNLQSAEYYFATLMDQLVEETMQLEPIDSAFTEQVNQLFYTIEAVRFLVDRGIFTDNPTCLAVYNLMMIQIGINTSLPDLTVDNSLLIPGIDFIIPYIGPQGPAGPQGSQGASGSQGVQGSQGAQGPQGFQGANGTSVVIKGSVQSVANLPPTGNTPGDLYIVLDDGDGYVWSGTAWNNVGQIQGPQGNQGPQGIQGSQGVQGSQGSGTQGVQGPQGFQGVQGTQGFQGDQGPRGFQGFQGYQGPQGPQGTLFGGTLNTLSKFGGSNTLVNSNVTDSGSTVSVDVNTNINGAINIGSGAGAFINSVNVVKQLTGSISTIGVYQLGVVQSDVATAVGFKNEIRTAAASFNLTNYYHYVADLGSIGAGSTITNQYAFYASNGITSATNNYAFYGDITPGIGRWNLYMAGGASNYIGGNLGIGISSGTEKLTVQGNTYVSGSITGNSFVKIGGTSSQFLKANGTVDSNTYVISAGTASYVPYFYTSNTLNNSNIRIGADETIGLMVGIGGSPNDAPTPRRLYVSGDSYFNGNIYTNNSINTTAGVVADALIKSGGSGVQILAANGSVITAGTNITISGGAISAAGNVSGSGTANYVAKFSGTNAISNSQIFDNGLVVGINTNTPSFYYKLDVAGSINYQNSFVIPTTSYTLILTDASRIIQTNSASPNNVTIPLDSNVAFPIGTEIAIIQYGSGQTTLARELGVILYSKSNARKISGQFAGCTIVKTATDTWVAVGDLTL